MGTRNGAFPFLLGSMMDTRAVQRALEKIREMADAAEQVGDPAEHRSSLQCVHAPGAARVHGYRRRVARET